MEVSLSITETRQVELEIADSGIGVADDQLALLGQRFNRNNQSATEGVGLGLSIVQRIAVCCGAVIETNTYRSC